MSEAAKEARREYMRQYRIINGDRMRAQERERYKKNKEYYRNIVEKHWEKKARELAEVK